MKRFLAVPLLTLGLGACTHPVSRAEFTELLADYQALQLSYDTLLAQLTVWADPVFEWVQVTDDVVCDIARANGPMTKYTPATQDYCGPGDPGNDPPPPPEWGG